MDHNKTTKLNAFTLLETIIAMTLISIIFLIVIQSFNSMILGSYLIDARTAVRNEGEFIGEYFKLRVKNADPRSIVCNNSATPVEGNPGKSITWQNLGASDKFTFLVDQQSSTQSRFCLSSANTVNSCDKVLTYNDVTVKDVNISCEGVIDIVTGQKFTTINLTFDMDSTVKLGDRPAVRDVSRFISVAVR